MSELGGTVALVTGASSGIGEATALALSAQGAKVALVARRGDRLREVAGRIGNGALVIEADVTHQDQAERAVERTVEEFGRLDTLVNNAGMMLLGPTTARRSTSGSRWSNINVYGLLYCAHAALPHLLEAARTLRVRLPTSSTSARLPAGDLRAGSAVYNLTKSGSARSASPSARRSRPSLRSHSSSRARSRPSCPRTTARRSRPIRGRFGDMERMQASDIADAITYIVTRPRHMSINEILIRPTEQAD